MKKTREDPFNIYIDRLKDDDTEKIFEVVDPSFLEVEEKDLSFTEKVTVSGQAYLAKNHLILDLKIKTKATLPCSICNRMIQVPIEIDDFSHTQELCEVPSAIYDFSDEVRSSILLKIPQFVECGGKCVTRKELNSYLKKEENAETYTPFADL